MTVQIEHPRGRRMRQAVHVKCRKHRFGVFWGLALVFAGWTAMPLPAYAELGVSPAIVDFQSGHPPRADLELVNNGSQRLYVVVEPSEIAAPGTDAEQRIQDPDPQVLGLLATPSRLILEPGQRKFVRIAMLKEAGDRDRIYRVTVKPVVGPVEAPVTGLKILVGYDVLVIQRPAQPKAVITGARSGEMLSLRNLGDTNAQLFNGKQCDARKGHCTSLPGSRLYAGATWNVPIRPGLPVEYLVKVGHDVTVQQF